jgi:plasmid rolling circle replication initiator protein Rep
LKELHKQEAVEDIKKGNKLDKGKADYKTNQSLTKYIKTDSNTIFFLAQFPQ